MRKALGYILLFFMLALTALTAQKTPPSKVVIKAKPGNVTFNHAEHVKREKSDCKVCHPALFKQDMKAPVGFRPPHKAEEEKKAACGACHRPGGTAFETKGNCSNGKCHERAAAK